MFSGGHYGTVKAHCYRWQALVRWFRCEQGPGINDARQIDRKVLANYAAHLRDLVGRGDLTVRIVHNRLSSLDRTMAALRGDRDVKLPSPSKVLSMQRTWGGHLVAHGQDRKWANQIFNALCRQYQSRPNTIGLLARATGLRFSETLWLTFQD